MDTNRMILDAEMLRDDLYGVMHWRAADVVCHVMALACRIAELEQRIAFHDDVKSAFKEATDSLLARNAKLRGWLTVVAAYFDGFKISDHDAACEAVREFTNTKGT